MQLQEESEKATLFHITFWGGARFSVSNANSSRYSPKFSTSHCRSSQPSRKQSCTVSGPILCCHALSVATCPLSVMAAVSKPPKHPRSRPEGRSAQHNSCKGNLQEESTLSCMHSPTCLWL